MTCFLNCMLYVTQHRIKYVVIDETGTIILVKAMTYFKIPINCSESIWQGGPSFSFLRFLFLWFSSWIQSSTSPFDNIFWKLMTCFNYLSNTYSEMTNYHSNVAILLKRTQTYQKPGSSVSIVSDYGLDDRASEVRSPAAANDFSFNLCVQIGSGIHPV
jgi:hypothetical protein